MVGCFKTLWYILLGIALLMAGIGGGRYIQEQDNRVLINDLIGRVETIEVNHAKNP